MGTDSLVTLTGEFVTLRRAEMADAEFDFECRIEDTADYHARLDRNSRHHREIFLRRGKVGLYTNWVEFIAHTDYDARGRCGAIPGEKAVFMNPRTRYEDIDRFIAAVRG